MRTENPLLNAGITALEAQRNDALDREVMLHIKIAELIEQNNDLVREIEALKAVNGKPGGVGTCATAAPTEEADQSEEDHRPA